MKYELMYIISSAASEEQREALINKFSAMVEEKGGKIVSLEKMGMRKFAYPINFKNEGFYVLMTFEADAVVVDEMNKLMNITENIVRQMFIKK
ncbi:MAG: 30S ribosomal protein S6 [Clostridia bacterium]|nr:30S ribosomal protein S6 [Clostridia bacterium]